VTERNFEFRRRISVVHKPDRRDPAARPGPDETVVSDGWAIVVPEGATDVLLTAAKDLQDYFFTSMGLSLLLRRTDSPQDLAASGEGCILLATKADLPDLGAGLSVPRSFRLLVGPQRVVVCGNEDRGAAQGSYHLEDLMNLREAPFLAQGDTSREPLFSPRMIHSGWGLDAYPDDYLNAMAHHGFDAALVFVGTHAPQIDVVDRTPKGYQDFNDLIARAARYGIDVYAYSYIQSPKHPDDPDAEAYYETTYGALFRACPGFKGVTLVGESVEFPSKDPHTTGRMRLDPSPDGLPQDKPSPGWWPCEDYPQWLNLLKRVIRRYSPQADIVFWTYNWGWTPEENRLALIRSLPSDITVQATFEMFEQRQRENITSVCVDYTLSFEGPGKYFAGEAQAVHERGLRLYTMSNTAGLTWDFGVIPYQPAPFQWDRRWQNLLKARQDWGLSGLMESHHYGWWPSFVSELAKNAFWSGGEPTEDRARAIARRDFGPEAAPLVVDAWHDWSEATRDYVPTNEDQYGPFRVGPSYPMLFRQVVNLPQAWYAMFGNSIIDPDYRPHESARQSPGPARFPVEIRSLERMEQRWEQGLAKLERALEVTPERKRAGLEEMINLGRFIIHCLRTTIHLKQWWLLKHELFGEADPARANALLDQMVELAEREIVNAQETIPLVERDSRLGFEPSMEYMTDRRHLEWKIAVVRRVVDHEIAQYRKALALVGR
jgi:hypothetical protein